MITQQTTLSRFWGAPALLLLPLLLLGALSCKPQQNGASSGDGEHSGPLRVVTTTTMITDMAGRIGGDEIQLTGLMGPGLDPHSYKATASDIATLGNADVVFYNGLHLEGRLTDVLERNASRGKAVHALSDAIPKEQVRTLDPDSATSSDPHIWGSAEVWSNCAKLMADVLAKADPPHAQLYQERAEALRQEYLALHAWAKERVAGLPGDQRLLITSHDAFNYFGEAYGFEVLGIQGLSTATEAGLADISRLADLIRARKVKAIFVESSVPPSTIEQLSKDSGAKIGGELFSDALGIPGEVKSVNGESYDLGTYEGFIKHNINTAVEALK